MGTSRKLGHEAGEARPDLAAPPPAPASWELAWERLRGVASSVGAPDVAPVHLYWGFGLVLAVCYGAQIAQFGDYIVDDAAITYAYSQNLVQGHGLTVNPGETAVEGYSNPLWMVILAVTMALGLFDPVWTPKVLGVVLTLGTAICGFALVRRVVPEAPGWMALLVPSVMAINGSVALWSVAGLENSLFGFLIVGSLLVYARDVSQPERFPLSGFGWVLVALTRPEGLMYGLLAAGDAAIRLASSRDLRWAGRFYGSMVAPLAVYAALHLMVFGALAPNTYLAKIRTGQAPLFERLTDFDKLGWRYVRGAVSDWRLLWVVLAATPAYLLPRNRERGLWLVASAVAASVVFVLVSDGDWMIQYRFLTPFFMLLPVLAAAGCTALLLRVPAAARGVAEVGGALSLLGLLTWSAQVLPAQLHHMRVKAPVPITQLYRFQERVVTLLDAIGAEAPWILASDVGVLVYRANGRYRTMDMFGLTDRTVALALHDGGDVDRLWTHGFSKHAPPLVQVASHTSSIWKLAEHPTFAADYIALDKSSPDKPVGLFLRRDAIEAPREPDLATASAQRQGELLVLRTRVEDGQVAVWFSVAQALKTQPVVQLQLEGASAQPLSLPLFKGLPPSVFEPGRVYLYRSPVAAGITGAHLAGATDTVAAQPVEPETGSAQVGVSDRSFVIDAQEPGPGAAPKGMFFGLGKGVDAELKRMDFGEGRRGVRLIKRATGIAELCTLGLPVQPGPYRVEAMLRIEDIQPGTEHWHRFNLFARGAGLNNQVLYKGTVAGPWRMVQADLVVPDQTREMGICATFTLTTGTVDIDRIVVTPL